MAGVMRGCRSLALIVSSWISTPSALPASGSSFSRSITSQAGMKSFHRRRWSLAPCANAGAVREASIAPRPAPVARRKVRRGSVRLPVSMLSPLPVDLLEFTRRPLHGVFGLRTLHALREHVHDDVLRVDLGGLRRRGIGEADHAR